VRRLEGEKVSHTILNKNPGAVAPGFFYAELQLKQYKTDIYLGVTTE
jgi:hypothetical protein